MSESEPFAGNTALITGGAIRLGAYSTSLLSQGGAKVIIHYNTSRTEADELLQHLQSKDAEAHVVQADFSQADVPESFFQDLIVEHGPIDILINNASIYPGDSVASMNLESLERNIRINAMAPFQLGRAFAAQGGSGVILNLLDTRMTDYDKEHLSYHLSKRMLFSLTKIMAIEFAPDIRVNAIAPGLILPPTGEDESYLRRLADTNPLNSYGSPEDFTQAVSYLLQSRFVTGQVIFVDGGRHLKGNLYG